MRLLLTILQVITFSFWSSCIYAQTAKTVDGAVIVYGGLSGMSEEGFQRVMNAGSVRYICVQHILHKDWDPAASRQRAQKLAKTGKRIVLQIWWGPAGDFPWSKYSFPNIALDESVRADFFKEVVDPCITGYGAGNLYGIHLLEETGMQFATDVGPRKDPDDFQTYEAPTSSYNTPWYSGFKSAPDKPDGGVNIANLRRHEADFTRMTGFKFADVSKDKLPQYLFDRWISTRLQSGAQVEFAKYIHKKYPRLKAFTWDLINSSGENPRTDHQLESQYFDGVITDPYNNITYNFCYQRAYRTLYPKGEIINFAMGGMGDAANPYESADVKRARTAAAYIAGVDVCGFFEIPQDYNRIESWNINTNILSKLKSMPKFKKKSSVLVISDGTGNVFHFPMAWTGLKYFDFLPTWEAHHVDLSSYQVVIMHIEGGDSLIYWNSDAVKKKYGLPGYLDYRKLDSFVAGGGTLILSGQTRMTKDCPLFIVREGYLHTADTGGVVQDPMVVSPEGWLRDKAGLKRTYTTAVTSIPVTYDSTRVTKTDAGYFFRHGKGSVFFFPFLRLFDPSEPYTSQKWQDYRQILTDVTRGVLGTTGKKEIAEEYLNDPQVGNYYMQATSDSGQQTGYIVRDGWGWPDLMVQKKWQVKGKDVFTGTTDPVLSKDTSTALFINQIP